MGDIPRNVLQHSSECLATFPGMFDDIPWNVWGHKHSRECLRTVPGMFEDIPWNITFPPFPAFLHSVSCSCIPGFTHNLATLHIGKSKPWEKTTGTAFRNCSANSCFVKLRKIHRKVPVLESHLRIVAGL